LNELPPREIFPPDMPRYPNLWFFVDRDLALRGTPDRALRFLVHILEQQIGLCDTFCEEIGNPNLINMVNKPGEGSDFQARVGPFHSYINSEDPVQSHRHQVHARFYVSALLHENCLLRSLQVRERNSEFFLIPASVHYEVCTESPLHPYADDCPWCGNTGEYAVPIDRSSQDYCVKIHDPLGLELLVHGTVRGKIFPGEDPIVSLKQLRGEFNVYVEEAEQDVEPIRLALVYLVAGGN